MPLGPTTRLCAVALAVLGCSHDWRPLDSAALAASRPQAILVGLAATPDFYVDTPGARVAAAVFPPSAIAFQVARKDFVQEHGIADPGPRIAARLTQALAGKLSMEVKEPRAYRQDLGVKQYWGVDLVLIVRTESWGLRGLSHYAPDGKHGEVRCRIEYHAVLELHDARNQRTLATGLCVAPPRTIDSAPVWDAAMADDARFVKAELDTAVDYCGRGFARKLLGLRVDERGALYGEPSPVPPVR